MSFYLDLSHFLTEPMTTGIQRIAGEICRYSMPGAAIPVRLDTGRCVAFSPDLIGTIGRYFRDASSAGAAEILKLGAMQNGTEVELRPEDMLLEPEIFDERRAAFYLRMGKRQFSNCRFIVYDLLPYTHPQHFPPGMPRVLGGYYQVIRRAACCGFISEYTRQTYYTRLRRAPANGGVVLPLGCDSLGPRAAEPKLHRPLTFSVLGTIEPRKNHQLILEAFEPLLKHFKGLTLALIGKMGWVENELPQKVRTLAADPGSGLKFLSVLPDDAIRSHVEQSRATIYISDAEGYGLPPVESLWLGTPVIASATIPSLESLGKTGVHYVQPLTVENLRKAVVAFLDDDYAERKASETATLNLPTWQTFAREVIDWCSLS